jgi:hypothetical protein
MTKPRCHMDLAARGGRQPAPSEMSATMSVF